MCEYRWKSSWALCPRNVTCMRHLTLVSKDGRLITHGGEPGNKTIEKLYTLKPVPVVIKMVFYYFQQICHVSISYPYPSPSSTTFYLPLNKNEIWLIMSRGLTPPI